MVKGLRSFAKESVQDGKEKKVIFRQVEELAFQVGKNGLCGLLYYAMYAGKPLTVSATS